MSKSIVAVVMMLLFAATAARAQHGGGGESHASGGATHAAASQPDAEPHPIFTFHHKWSNTLVGVIVVMFLLAMIIGPIVRASTPEEVPPAHSHDEPPGTSGHHGHSGTIDTHPPEEKLPGHGHGH